MLIHDGWRLRSGRRGWIKNHPSLSCIRFCQGDDLKQFWPQRVCSGCTSEALRLPEWEQHRRPKVWEKSVSLMPPGRGSGGYKKIQSPEPGCFSESPGHPASPSQGPLDTFPPAALGKQTRHCAQRSSVCALVEYGRAPSTGCLLLYIRIHFVWTSSKHTPKGGYSQGLTIS